MTDHLGRSEAALPITYWWHDDRQGWVHTAVRGFFELCTAPLARTGEHTPRGRSGP